jgi:hypothetical protein
MSSDRNKKEMIDKRRDKEQNRLDILKDEIFAILKVMVLNLVE